MRRFMMLLLLGACFLFGPRQPGEAEERRPVPRGARVRVELDRKQYFLGENVLLHFCVENTGGEPFKVEFGGDYRGSPRPLRFSVHAVDAQGKEVADPSPNPMCMGGLSYAKELKPGDKHFETLQLTRYRRFEKPGIYRLSVSHDLC